MSCPLMFISTESKMEIVISIISLHFLTTFSRGEKRLLLDFILFFLFPSVGGRQQLN